MEKLSFKKWLAEVMSQGGIVDKEPSPEQRKAGADYHGPDSEELPPTKRNNFRMKKKMKKK